MKDCKLTGYVPNDTDRKSDKRKEFFRSLGREYCELAMTDPSEDTRKQMADKQSTTLVCSHRVISSEDFQKKRMAEYDEQPQKASA